MFVSGFPTVPTFLVQLKTFYSVKKRRKEEENCAVVTKHSEHIQTLSFWTISISVFHSTNYGTSRTHLFRFLSQVFVGLVQSIF